LRVPAATLGCPSDVIEIVDTYLYRTLRKSLAALAAVTMKLESGRRDAYMFIALTAVIAFVVAMA
jgi:hypothetical protein